MTLHACLFDHDEDEDDMSGYRPPSHFPLRMTLLVAKSSSTCHVYLITAVVPFPHRQLVELPCDMFSGAGVCIPVDVDAIVVGDEVGCLLFFMIIVVAMPAGSCPASMELVADLALRVVAFLLLLLLWLRAKRC